MTMSFHSLLRALRRGKPILIGLRELSEGVPLLHTTLHILLLFCVLKVDTVLRDCVKKINEFPTNGVSVFTIVFFSRIDFYCPQADQQASGSKPHEE